MRYVAPITFDTTRHLAVAGQMRGWIASVLLWFCEVFDTLPPMWRRSPALQCALIVVKAKLASDLRWTSRLLRRVAGDIAYARLDTRGGAARCVYRRPGAPRLRRRRNKLVRRFTGGILRGLHHGTLRQRAERLRALLDDFDTLIARIHARMCAMWRFTLWSADKLPPHDDEKLRGAALATPAFPDSS